MACYKRIVCENAILMILLSRFLQFADNTCLTYVICWAIYIVTVKKIYTF